MRHPLRLVRASATSVAGGLPGHAARQLNGRARFGAGGDGMREYVQYNGSNLVHIVCGYHDDGVIVTQCDKWYHPSASRIRGLNGKQEADIVCRYCREKAAIALGKRVYYAPQLRRDVSKVKQKHFQNCLAEVSEKKRLAEWNRKAQEVKPGNN
jgi:hypothetical protein